MAEIIYYASKDNDYYINSNNDYYIAKVYDLEPTELYYLKYKPYIYHNGEFKKYIAYIRKSDGSYQRLNPHIYTEIKTAIAGIAIAGASRAGAS